MCRAVLVALVSALAGSAAGAGTAAEPPSAAAPTLAPRNVILFVCDGGGYNQLDAASLYERGATGRQVYASFPVRLAMETRSASGRPYSPSGAWADLERVRERPTDSAASATALSTGVRTANGAIGVAPDGRRLRHVTQRAKARGKACGVVTSVPFAHATPAGFVAHDRSRNHYEAIAREMLLESRLDVIMGCGHPLFDDDGDSLAAPVDFRYVGGEAVWRGLRAGAVLFDLDGDGRSDDAVEDSDGDGARDPWTLIEEADAFRALASGAAPRRILGIPRVARTLQYERSGPRDAAPREVPFQGGVPSLAEMALAALNVLDDDPDGFFVVIEGGAIDWACHDNAAGRMIEEAIEFDRAVEAVVRWIEERSGWDETLVVVTADHETGCLAGPGSGRGGPPVWKPLVGKGRGRVPALEWHSDGHSSHLVPLFAKGAASAALAPFADERDPVRGPYLDIVEVGRFLTSLQVAGASPSP